ncbi:MAG: hypothetical protein ACM3W4_06480 [Ignavibacteriales bacterium]
MAAGLVLAAAGAAQAAPKDLGRAAVLEAVVSCRGVADTAARLACYDAAAARLDEAEAKGDVVILDREQTREARREAFGFSLPSLNVFNRGEEPEKINRATFTVDRAWKSPDDKWVVQLDSGAVWRQTDTTWILKKPHKGSTADISTGALGSYFMKLDGQTAMRAHRDK